MTCLLFYCFSLPASFVCFLGSRGFPFCDRTCTFLFFLPSCTFCRFLFFSLYYSVLYLWQILVLICHVADYLSCFTSRNWPKNGQGYSWDIGKSNLRKWIWFLDGELSDLLFFRLLGLCALSFSSILLTLLGCSFHLSETCFSLG